MPESGKYVYLGTICRYVSLPEDVVLIDQTLMASCAPDPSRKLCPDWPQFTYERGKARVRIDMSGDLRGAEEDKAQFPFFQVKSP